MSDNEGLYNKYEVVRIDGKPEKNGVRYFVFDYANDPDAAKALMTYAMLIRHKKPRLSRELVRNLDLLKAIGLGEAVEP